MRCKLFVGQNGNRLLWLLSGIIMIVFWLCKLIEVGFIFFNNLIISLKNNDNSVKLTSLLTDLYLSHVKTNWSINTVWLFMVNIFSNTHLAVCFSYAFKELRHLKIRYWDQKFCNNFKPLWGFETQFVDSPVKMNKLAQYALTFFCQDKVWLRYAMRSATLLQAPVHLAAAANWKLAFVFVNCSKCLSLCCLSLLFSLREFAAETAQISEGLQYWDESGGGWMGPGLHFTGGGKGSRWSL